VVNATLLVLSLAAAQDTPKAPPGWNVELVAKAPVINHPTVVCGAPDGRVFVAEDPMDISAPASARDGRILCFHPNGRITVFAQDLHACFGMQYLEGRLYVLHNPKYTRFVDDDGVGRDRTDLIESTNPEPWALDWNDHVPSNFKLAMDGYFYISVGDKGVYGAVGRDGSRADLRGGGILRMRPDATELEVYCSGTRNTLDVILDADDELFTYDNTDEHHWMSRLTHMVEGGFYGYPWDFNPRRPYTLWMMADYGPGAATNTTAYLEDALPREYHGDFFIADYGKRSVARVKVARDGATFKALSREDFFVNGGEKDDFRPVGLWVTPDGMGFCVSDWNHKDNKAKDAAGRLWKFTWTGKSGAAPRPAWYAAAAMGRPVEAPTEDLVKALSHPSRSVRLTAQRRLTDRKAAESLVADVKAPAQARIHALWALDAMGGSALAAADDPALRAQALRQLATRRVKEAAALFQKLLKDPDPVVRFRAATGLGRLGEASAVPALRESLDDGDSFARFAAFTALHRIGVADSACWGNVAMGLRSQSAAVREGTLFAMRGVYDPCVVELLHSAARKASIPAETRALAVAFLAELHRQYPPWKGEWWNGFKGLSPYHPALSARPPKTVEWGMTPRVLEELRDRLDDEAAIVRRAAIEGLVEVREDSAAPKMREMFPREADAGVKRAILRALATFHDAPSADLVGEALKEAVLQADAVVTAEAVGARDALERFVGARPNDREVMLKAIEALGRLKSADALLPLVADQDAEFAKAAIGALGRMKEARAVESLLAAFGREETKFEAAMALAQFREPRALDAYLFGLGSPNAGLREAARKALRGVKDQVQAAIEERAGAGTLPRDAVAELQQILKESEPLKKLAAARLDPDVYFDFALKNGGDAARGRKLFADLKGLACLKCHKVAGEGGEIGPELTTIGTQFGRKDLAESVLWPSRRVREGYLQVIIQTKDGDVLSGVVRSETGDEIVLQDAEGGRHAIRRKNVEKQRWSDLSLMPEGLSSGLSLQDFADLVTYLESLGKSPKK
jgi:putative heme-binding domain-containing protein